ncbi:MAG TPA: hypothetical protein VGK86_09930 [Thermoanaerobaculia bacterium]|jgi:hypothetical protein
MRKTALGLLAAALVAAVAAVGCKKTETVSTPPAGAEPPAVAASPVPAATGAHVERITVAKAVNADDSPGEAATTFGKSDTVYVSMWTANTPVGTEITARWFGPDGKQLTENKIVTDKAGGGYTSFHAANAKGWAPGAYRVDVLLNGAPAASTTFTIS